MKCEENNKMPVSQHLNAHQVKDCLDGAIENKSVFEGHNHGLQTYSIRYSHRHHWHAAVLKNVLKYATCRYIFSLSYLFQMFLNFQNRL